MNTAPPDNTGTATAITYPFSTKPQDGELINLAPGV